MKIYNHMIIFKMENEKIDRAAELSLYQVCLIYF